MGKICLHGYVSGRVQGVYYRQTTAEQAECLGLDGWVRNLEDGRVELLVEGEREAVRTLAAWLEEGPPEARVTSVELSEQPLQAPQGFVIRR